MVESCGGIVVCAALAERERDSQTGHREVTVTVTVT